ncbi:MAG: hypothetical protein ACR2KL_03230 [Nocardioidaceae bacterium]
MAVFLFFVIVAIVLGLIGIFANGLLWLLWIGIAVLVLDLVLFGARIGRGTARRPAR